MTSTHAAFRIAILDAERSAPAGKLADAEIHFQTGPLAGLKLIGFGVWARRTGGLNVTFPARQYSVNGERRSFALLRPIEDANAQDAIRAAILDAYDAHTAGGHAPTAARFPEAPAPLVTPANVDAIAAQILGPAPVPESPETAAPGLFPLVTDAPAPDPVAVLMQAAETIAQAPAQAPEPVRANLDNPGFLAAALAARTPAPVAQAPAPVRFIQPRASKTTSRPQFAAGTAAAALLDLL